MPNMNNFKVEHQIQDSTEIRLILPKLAFIKDNFLCVTSLKNHTLGAKVHSHNLLFLNKLSAHEISKMYKI